MKLVLTLENSLGREYPAVGLLAYIVAQEANNLLAKDISSEPKLEVIDESYFNMSWMPKFARLSRSQGYRLRDDGRSVRRLLIDDSLLSMEVSMRCVFVLAFLAAPSAYAAQPYCALPAAPVVPIALQPVRAADPGQALAGLPVATALMASVVPSSPPPSLPAALTSLAFVQHVASVGATVDDLGAAHGLHTISARHGGQFMIFQVTPDGQAAVSGAMTDLTPSQLAAVAGENVTDLIIEHGLRGFFVRSGGQSQVFYAAPDDQRLIPGVLYDATGKDITRQQVAGIPGAIPTVEVGQVAEPGATGPNGPSGPGGPGGPSVAALPLVRKAASGSVGPATAPHLWMLIDPQCVYSVRAYQALQPYVASGRLGRAPGRGVGAVGNTNRPLR